MTFYKRYDKKIIEEYSIKTISNSFNCKYSTYYSLDNTDNFDYLSEDKRAALEITTVIPQNVLEAYVYEKQHSVGKNNLSTKKIKNGKYSDDGAILSYYGGSMQEIKIGIQNAIKKKQDITIKRCENSPIEVVDLCVCVQDGNLFDLHSFEIAFGSFKECIFDNIFFITPSHFIRYNKLTGFEEYEKK